ncbi:hypothetical protein E2C01_068765 [Portunus trituberculatus]|uniref:Uncharacterized protein n=1 Tax=Portunus trituberculatus TaxID=210409 RepID=A0A5B7HYS5_PORTR|nr:hypothetical protein [Portunus trituberculatus]
MSTLLRELCTYISITLNKREAGSLTGQRDGHRAPGGKPGRAERLVAELTVEQTKPRVARTDRHSLVRGKQVCVCVCFTV